MGLWSFAGGLPKQAAHSLPSQVFQTNLFRGSAFFKARPVCPYNVHVPIANHTIASANNPFLPILGPYLYAPHVPGNSEDFC